MNFQNNNPIICNHMKEINPIKDTKFSSRIFSVKIKYLK